MVEQKVQTGTIEIDVEKSGELENIVIRARGARVCGSEQETIIKRLQPAAWFLKCICF